MAIYVKNKRLKKRVFKQLDKYDKLTMKEYKKGNIKKGRIYEAKSDKLYKDNYYKMFTKIKNAKNKKS